MATPFPSSRATRRQRAILYLQFPCFLLVVVLSSCRERGEGQKKLATASLLGRDSAPTVGVKVLPPVFNDEASHLKCDIPVTNNSAQRVHFAEIRPSCGCSSAILSDRDLEPGQQTVLHIETAIRDRTGPEKVFCVLIDQDGNTRNYEIRTTIYSRVAFSPREIRFGLVDPNKETSSAAELSFFSRDLADLPAADSLNFRCADELKLTVSAAPTELKNSDGVFVRKIPLAVVLVPGPGSGPATGAITVSFDWKGLKQESRLPIAWNVRNLYDISPMRAFFIASDVASETLERRISIRRTDNIPFVIRKLTPSCPAIECSVATGSQPLTVHEAVLQLDLKAVEKPSLCGEVSVLTDHPVQPLLKIPFAAVKRRS